MRKALLLLVVILGLAPGTWLRSPPPPVDTRQILTFTALQVPKVDLGPLELGGAWTLHSPNSDFGSYSALVALGDGTLLAASDKGSMMRFSPPGAPRAPVSIGYFGQDPTRAKRWLDIESMTRDPVSGRLWLGFEYDTRIERFDPDFRAKATVRPKSMRGWSGNSGPEAMVRLADGRFIVISEGAKRWFGGDVPGVLFPSDPVQGAEPDTFRFEPPAGYRPVDMAQLPDGRVVILLRSIVWGLPPGFAGKLVLADPANIRKGAAWQWEPLADLASPLPTDNFEGLAVEPDADGSRVLWLISDDNSSILQRTLLLSLRWPGNAKARENPRALR